MDNQESAPKTQQESIVRGKDLPPWFNNFLLLFLYIAFCTSFLCAVFPISYISIFALMICICVLAGIYTYRVRGKKAKDKLVIAHTSYMIRTFWNANILFAISAFFGLLYMLVVVDYHPLEVCTEALFSAVNHGNMRSVNKIIDFCGELIFEKNRQNLKVAGFIACLPVFIYVLWRCMRGSCLLAFYKTQLDKKTPQSDITK